MTGSGWRDHAARLAEQLAGRGLDGGWAAAVAAVPRHEFVTTGRAVDTDDPARERARLLERAYTDTVIVTRYATVDGRPIPTSSASQPTIVAAMLRLLAVAEDSRVLEIGTGPGYNAALLCQRLGDAAVTSVDVQADVVAEARERLARLGFRPYLAVADGALGCPSRAPFDRIIATCGLDAIPSAWLPQLAPGARIVAPMNYGGALAVLDRRDDGSVSGHFDAEAGFFMVLRPGGRPPPPEYPVGLPPPVPIEIDADLETLGDLDFRLWLELSAPVLRLNPYRDETNRVVRADVTTVDGYLELNEGAVPMVAGRSPWPAVAEAVASWTERGRPERTRLGLTVTPSRQWVWLDAEDDEVSRRR